MTYYEYVKQILESKKTTSSKKSFLKKEIKAMKEHLKDLKEAYSSPKGERWLHGKQIYKFEVDKQERETKWIESTLSTIK